MFSTNFLEGSANGQRRYFWSRTIYNVCTKAEGQTTAAFSVTFKGSDLQASGEGRAYQTRAITPYTARLEGSTFYDVLEVSPLAEIDEIDAAAQSAALRFAPEVLATHELSDLAGLVQPTWELVIKAHAVLVDHAQRGRYHDWLRQKLPELRTVWAMNRTSFTSLRSASKAVVLRGSSARAARKCRRASRCASRASAARPCWTRSATSRSMRICSRRAFPTHGCGTAIR